MKLKLKWVSEIIGDDYKSWQNGDIVRIECQTGTGKTFFVINKLLPHAINQGKKILYICNRIYLKRQMKINVAEIQGIEINYNDIDELEVIGNITITSYQKIQNSILNVDYNIYSQDDLYEKYLDFDYIVWDECHFLVQDAAFNNKTVFFYDQYLNKCNKDCITLLLSATMDHIRELYSYNDKIIDYSTGIDYSYLNVFYFKNYEDIIATINNDNSGNKWLFFINNFTLAVELLEKIKDSKFICSQNNQGYVNKMDSNELNNIVANNKFDCKCLIGTKVIDNGISINDPLLKNIVILTFDKVDFIQMLGRKRIDIEYPQRINLFIMKRSIKSFTTMLYTKYYKDQKEVELYKNDINGFNRKYDKSIGKMRDYEYLFYKGKSGNWELNKMGYLMLFKNIEFCERMKNEFYKSGKNAFIKEQLKWIKIKYNKSNWLDEIMNDKKIDEIEEYLESIVGKRLYKKEQEELIEKVRLTDPRGRTKRRHSVYNESFKEDKLPFIIISKSTKDKERKNITYWVVERLIE